MLGEQNNIVWNDPPLFFKNQKFGNNAGEGGGGRGDGIKSDLSAILLFCCTDKAASIFWLGDNCPEGQPNNE